ncbi:hypothetical protein C8R45DRAFT_993269 [Mycena sanguinolenta]|nr:hypothetical protein C8R45DRAFT_993269 [Mycena sanguinolenta]
MGGAGDWCCCCCCCCSCGDCCCGDDCCAAAPELVTGRLTGFLSTSSGSAFLANTAASYDLRSSALCIVRAPERAGGWCEVWCAGCDGCRCDACCGYTGAASISPSGVFTLGRLATRYRFPFPPFPFPPDGPVGVAVTPNMPLAAAALALGVCSPSPSAGPVNGVRIYAFQNSLSSLVSASLVPGVCACKW